MLGPARVCDCPCVMSVGMHMPRISSRSDTQGRALPLTLPLMPDPPNPNAGLDMYIEVLQKAMRYLERKRCTLRHPSTRLDLAGESTWLDMIGSACPHH